jgi:hypothetical protein
MLKGVEELWSRLTHECFHEIGPNVFLRASKISCFFGAVKRGGDRVLIFVCSVIRATESFCKPIGGADESSFGINVLL